MVPQGLVNFNNNPVSLVSVASDTGFGPISGSPGSYYFGLLTSRNGIAGPFLFTGLYATNQAVVGRFNGGFEVAVPNWPAGTTQSYEIVGWSANLGHDFNPAWMNGNFLGRDGFYGQSAWATGVAGGFDGTGPVPPLNLFGGATGISQGFTLVTTLHDVPEPSPATLATLGVATLMLWRRKGITARR